jgi:hypothetical protein
VRGTGYYYDNFTVAAVAGTTYTITMNSTAVDAYLYLLSGATVLASNDDSNGTLNSTIVYRPTASATLTIHATSFAANATGAYSVTLTAATPPAAPSALTATVGSATAVNLTWADNSTNETGFLIERKTGSSGTWAQIASAGANARTYSNTGLSAGTTYYYRVRAYNALGNSAYSNEVSGMPPVSCSSSTTAINARSSVSGTLAATDCRSTVRGSGYYYDRFTFTAVAGTTYTLTMNSTALDAYLYLVNSAGTVLAFNDDSNGTLNSTIVYRATAAGTLTIHATSFSAGATGAYTVTRN